MTSRGGTARWRRRPAAVLAALATIVATLVVATAMRPVGLAEVLLVVLVEVVGVSLVAGRTLAAATAIGAFLAVNWLLVPPYGTLQIQSQENWVSLAVFLILAVGGSSLVEAVLASERAAASAAARESTIAEVLNPDIASARDALHALRTALRLDEAALVESSRGRVLVCTVDPPPSAAASMQVDVAPGFTVRGWGAELLGARPEYLTTLATAVVRAWQSEALLAEQERSARLAEVDAARAALLASVGHDLRTPLAGIRLSVDALAMSGEQLSEQDRTDLLDGLRLSALRLDSLLGAVLDASRIDAGVATVQPERADVRGIVQRAIGDFGSPRIGLDLPGESVTAIVDPVLLERVVANLVANALAHTPVDSPVDVRCRSRGSGAVVTVADHGPGLEPAATGPAAAGAAPGVRHRHRRERRRSSGRRAQPARHGAADRRSARGPDGPVGGAHDHPRRWAHRHPGDPGGAVMRVLIVEDDHTLRRSLSVALRARGFAVHDVADGGAALHALQALEYDVVLLDLGLPDTDGVVLLPELRAHHAGPVIVVSARRDQSDKVAALDAGADDYMTKPFGLSELLARIRAVGRRAGVGALVRTEHFTVDLSRGVVTDAAGALVPLTGTEWAVLGCLARAGGGPVSPEELLVEVWGDRAAEHRNYVRVYVNLLRRKLEPDPANPTCLLSQPGRGYWLAVAP